MSDSNALPEDMRIELGESLAMLANGQVKLQRLFALADAKLASQGEKLASQDAKIERLTDQIAVLVKLLDSHQHAIEVMQLRGGIVQ